MRSKQSFFVISVLILWIFALSAGIPSADGKVVKVSDLVKGNHPRRFERMAVFLERKGYFYSAVAFAKEHLVRAKSEKHLSDDFNQSLERIILKSGGEQFSLLNENHLKKSYAPSIFYVLGKKAYDEGDFKKSLNYLDDLPRTHRFQAEAHYIRASIFLLQEKKDLSEIEFKRCIKSTKFEKTITQNDKKVRFFNLIQEQCLMGLGRLYYQNKNYDKAMKSFDAIPKKSYIWPYTLLEKGWTAYKQKNYNRTLGAVVTLKAPLLESYFSPEAEVLMALSYHKMCLYDDSILVIENFHKNYESKAKILKRYLSQKHEQPYHYFKAVIERQSGGKSFGEEEREILNSLITQIQKELFFNLNLQLLNGARREIKKLRKQKNSFLKTLLLENTKDFEERQLFLLSRFVQRKLVEFTNDMNFYSKELYKIYLENLTEMKTAIYEQKKIANTRGRGDLRNVKRKDTQYFWKFRGGFWADELGEYVFGLKSNCEGANKNALSKGGHNGYF